MVAQPKGCTPAAYRRRSPADSPLYRAVQNHLETFLALRIFLDESERHLRAHCPGVGPDADDAEADRPGLERMLRYCARLPFAAERVEELDRHRLIYQLPKPGPDGRMQLILSPLELIERLAALVPPPRQHRHR